jgi:hypothetical protein
MAEIYVTMLSCSECRRNHGPDGDRNDDCDCWCHDGDIPDLNWWPDECEADRDDGDA